jgi:hypothetical protein
MATVGGPRLQPKPRRGATRRRPEPGQSCGIPGGKYGLALRARLLHSRLVRADRPNTEAFPSHQGQPARQWARAGRAGRPLRCLHGRPGPTDPGIPGHGTAPGEVLDLRLTAAALSPCLFPLTVPIGGKTRSVVILRMRRGTPKSPFRLLLRAPVLPESDPATVPTGMESGTKPVGPR